MDGRRPASAGAQNPAYRPARPPPESASGAPWPGRLDGLLPLRGATAGRDSLPAGPAAVRPVDSGVRSGGELAVVAQSTEPVDRRSASTGPERLGQRCSTTNVAQTCLGAGATEMSLRIA